MCIVQSVPLLLFARLSLTLEPSRDRLTPSKDGAIRAGSRVGRCLSSVHVFSSLFIARCASSIGFRSHLSSEWRSMHFSRWSVMRLTLRTPIARSAWQQHSVKGFGCRCMSKLFQGECFSLSLPESHLVAKKKHCCAAFIKVATCLPHRGRCKSSLLLCAILHQDRIGSRA